MSDVASKVVNRFTIAVLRLDSIHNYKSSPVPSSVSSHGGVGKCYCSISLPGDEPSTALRIQVQLATLSPDLVHQLTWGRFVNTHGGNGRM